ncbi:MAG: arginine--tRNA ligase [Firmicutes bacterium]|nr:arginine--tRNA ligase [Bacillota bacterium]
MLEQNTVLGQRKAAIWRLIESCLNKNRQEGKLNFEEIADFVVEQPREEAHGDFACNAAMVMAKACRRAPRDIAALLKASIEEACAAGEADAAEIEEASIAGPGFLNFRLKPGWLGKCMAEILAQGDAFGRSDAGQGQKIQVEFVSANPTGELHMGNARGAAIGDSLVNILNAAGFRAEREFYINDAGNQIEKFGLSLDALYQTRLGHPVPFPEDGYHGEDLPRLIDDLAEREGDIYLKLPEQERRRLLADYALSLKITDIRNALANFGVEYDVWFSERSLHESGAVQGIIDKLEGEGWLLQQDGALWLDCRRFGEEKPEVLVRNNGVPTYYAADIAYHDNKFRRGFDTVIDIWGADHHGHVARMQGAMEALGYDRKRLEVILMQFVRLYQGGQLLKMSKRTGQYVTLNELVEEVGRDAARFFFVMRSADSLIDFDMDLAKKQSADNPVYYVQYAHARICSILAAAPAGALEGPVDCALLQQEGEEKLIRKLAAFPDEVATAALSREPHRLAMYVMDLAAQFHNFYGQCHCLVEDKDLMRARLHLIQAVAGAIRRGLAMLGVSAPEKM